MAQGTVKKLVRDRGFGFIGAGDRDIFFHFTSLDGISFDDLQEGQEVEYELKEDDGSGQSRGPSAGLVKLA